MNDDAKKLYVIKTIQRTDNPELRVEYDVFTAPVLGDCVIEEAKSLKELASYLAEHIFEDGSPVEYELIYEFESSWKNKTVVIIDGDIPNTIRQKNLTIEEINELEALLCKNYLKLVLGESD